MRKDCDYPPSGSGAANAPMPDKFRGKCPSCRVSHTGMSCSEHRQLLREAEQRV